VAKASSKTETIEQTTVTLVLTEDEAFAVHAFASHGDDLSSDHPLYKASHGVYLALEDLLQGGDTSSQRIALYHSIEVDESVDW
jgi:hypothetical protein